jgi:hypothetical protein
MFGDFPDHLPELLLPTATLGWCSIVALHLDTMGWLHLFLLKVCSSFPFGLKILRRRW